MTTYQIAVNPRGTNEVVFDKSTRLLTDNQAIENVEIGDTKQQSFQSASFVLIDKNKSFHNNINIGSTVEILINDTLEFEGVISSIKKVFAGSIILKLQCVGNTFELERFRTAEDTTYTNQKTAAIAIQLMDSFGYNIFDTSSITSTDGVTVQTITFNAETLNTCLQRLTELDGYDYYVGRLQTVA